MVLKCESTYTSEGTIQTMIWMKRRSSVYWVILIQTLENKLGSDLLNKERLVKGDNCQFPL